MQSVFIKQTTFINSKAKAIDLNSLVVYESKLKAKVMSSLTFLKNFACASSYLQTKTFA